MATSRNDGTVPKLKKTKGRTRILTDEEVDLIEAAIRSTDDEKYMGDDAKAFRQDAGDIFVVLCGTGARFREVSSLLWSQIDLEAKAIRLYRSKTDNEMALGMTDKAYATLLGRSENKRHPLYVFPNRAKDAPRGYSGRSLRNAIQRSGVVGATPHVIRHSVATKLLSQGMNLDAIRQILGHASITTTQRYVHTSKQTAAQQAAQILNR